MLCYRFASADDRDRFVESLVDEGVAAEVGDGTDAWVPAVHESLADEVFASVLDLSPAGDELPELRPDGTLVTVHETSDRFEAEMVIDHLGSIGIAAAALGGFDHSLLGVGTSVTTHRVQVHELDADAARALLEETKIVAEPRSTWTSTRSRWVAVAVAALLVLGFFGADAVLFVPVAVVIAAVVWAVNRARSDRRGRTPRSRPEGS